jgi:hypothetical protein
MAGSVHVKRLDVALTLAKITGIELLLDDVRNVWQAATTKESPEAVATCVANPRCCHAACASDARWARSIDAVTNASAHAIRISSSIGDSFVVAACHTLRTIGCTGGMAASGVRNTGRHSLFEYATATHGLTSCKRIYAARPDDSLAPPSSDFTSLPEFQY